MTNKNRRYLINDLVRLYGTRHSTLYLQGKPCMKISIDDGSKKAIISIELKIKK